MTFLEIPLKSDPQILYVPLGDTLYQFTIIYRQADQGGWVLDIADGDGNPILAGVPLVTGCDLLAQYPHLNIPVSLMMAGDPDVWVTPDFDGLGTVSKLYSVQ